MQRNVIDRVFPEVKETSPEAPPVESPPREQEEQDILALLQPMSAPPSAGPSIEEQAPGEHPPLPSGPSHPERETRRWLRRPWSYLLITLILLLVLGVSFGGGMLGARLFPPETGQRVTLSAQVADLQQAVENVSQGVQPSVVAVTSYNLGFESLASGIVLTSDGYIVTNDHAVNGFSAYTVTLADGKSFEARLIGEDGQDDLAVLKIAARGLEPVAFADSSKVVAGQFVVALGSPVGLENTATFGVVSGLNRTANETPYGPASLLVGLIQTNAAINPGNSGGALVNLQGQLIGIPTVRVAAISNGSDYPTVIEGTGFAIPANRIKYVATQLIQHGRLVHSNQGFLGIQGKDVTPQIAQDNGLSVQQGVLVTGFSNNGSGTSPAQQAGVQVNDVITAVNGAVIAANDDLAGAILTRAPTTRITLTIMRGAQQRTIAVTLAERPVSD